MCACVRVGVMRCWFRLAREGPAKATPPSLGEPAINEYLFAVCCVCVCAVCACVHVCIWGLFACSVRGHLPFEGSTREEVMARTAQAKLDFNHSVWRSWTRQGVLLLGFLL